MVVQLHVQYTKRPSSSFDWDCAHCCSAMLYFLVYKFVLHLGAERGKFGYHSPNIWFTSVWYSVNNYQRSTLYKLYCNMINYWCLFMNNSGVQVAATVWLHACCSQQLWPGEIFQEEYKLRSLWLLKALIFIVHNILLSAFFLCTNYCRTQRLLYMTEILMCEGAVNKCILEKK